MNKILKWSLGLVAAAGAAHVAYHGYQDLADNLRQDLTDAVRAEFADENHTIEAVWICDDPEHDAVFAGGVLVKEKTFDKTVKNLAFEIDGQSLKITRKGEETL